ncbi:glycosyltransferase [Limnobaculum parvum]|uniref:Glycosyltransferase family 4 protein n=1 Tax=Limnobaculum parvum TaxID=2172103 RepID=A0A2Y9U0S0_9GAMM|nr:glycosyltransferase [Limnobaculum parvum]AWH89656.1 glycosyltransferase family 4 protein [Limnobaculum parvum]
MQKIIFLIHDITKPGGTERVTLTLARNFQKEDVPCEIFSLNKENNIPFYSSGKTLIKYAKSNIRILSIIEAINYAKRNNAKLIVVSMGRLSIEVSFLARVCLFKNIYLYEHISFESFGMHIRILKYFSYLISKGTIFLTRHDVEFVKSKLPKIKAYSIDNINPYENINYIDINERENIVLAVGRLTDQKNFSRLINLWSKFENLGWKLLIIGSGPEKKKLENDIVDLKIKNILIHDATPNVDSYYKRSKVYVMTSKYEGLPMVLIEAQGFGLPAISFDCKTGPADIIQNNESGYIIPYDDDDDFINKLQSIMNDAACLSNMSKKAFVNAQRFTFLEVKNEWFKILSEESK